MQNIVILLTKEGQHSGNIASARSPHHEKVLDLNCRWGNHSPILSGVCMFSLCLNGVYSYSLKTCKWYNLDIHNCTWRHLTLTCVLLELWSIRLSGFHPNWSCDIHYVKYSTIFVTCLFVVHFCCVYLTCNSVLFLPNSNHVTFDLASLGLITQNWKSNVRWGFYNWIWTKQPTKTRDQTVFLPEKMDKKEHSLIQKYNNFRKEDQSHLIPVIEIPIL